ncbi:hypothetical protein ACFL0J_04405 [Candidatus Neomarinimicrobiota bacterium]
MEFLIGLIIFYFIISYAWKGLKNEVPTLNNEDVIKVDINSESKTISTECIELMDSIVKELMERGYDSCNHFEVLTIFKHCFVYISVLISNPISMNRDYILKIREASVNQLEVKLNNKLQGYFGVTIESETRNTLNNLNTFIDIWLSELEEDYIFLKDNRESELESWELFIAIRAKFVKDISSHLDKITNSKNSYNNFVKGISENQYYLSAIKKLRKG